MLYLFDGYNILHAGDFAGRRELVDVLASYVAVRGARLHRAGAEVDAVKLRYRSRAVPCRVAGDPAAGTHRRLELELAAPVDGAAPGQTACLLKGDVVVGYGTIGLT